MMLQQRPGFIDHLKSIIFLPSIVMVVIPFIIYTFLPKWGLSHFIGIPEEILFGSGILLGILSTSFFVSTLILFIRMSHGTLAPWAPSKKLVVRGYYRHARNPMIFGVLSILLSEAFYFNSFFILIWGIAFFTINHIYFIRREEPDLQERFGNDYILYKKNVPRWLPRRRGWRPEDE